MTATIAALAVVVEAGQVLLVRRLNPPDAGLWGYPGGRVEAGEDVATAALRELREETGVEAEAGETLDVIDVRAEGFHYALHAIACRYLSGSPRAADDVDAAEWVLIDDVIRATRPMSEGVAELARLIAPTG
ncbi:NUDIX hydrolase [Maritimibacter sp. UBA3975]|uniref:NUDIX hydrolase n=1 Tax=Maritimibacter sp. UBA3975 TaxID=1946833 RepID=UPI000C0996EA|nr:NUDIX hydrolase [Maritimibacter sp. UBA3975]MAM62396.1 NUDIX hydrolase [Maritimibacter sp.]|tara:strand:- start:15329 stop:15724 length:396 start_codon:yes stop_codon:yes gene_type:complete